MSAGARPVRCPRPWPGRRLAPDVRIRGEGDVSPRWAASCPSPLGAGGGTRLPADRVRKRAREKDRHKHDAGAGSRFEDRRRTIAALHQRLSHDRPAATMPETASIRPGRAPSRPTGAKPSAARSRWDTRGRRHPPAAPLVPGPRITHPRRAPHSRDKGASARHYPQGSQPPDQPQFVIASRRRSNPESRKPTLDCRAR